MDNDYENVKKGTEECQKALTDELDTYALSRIRLSTPGRSLKTLHRKQARSIINTFFNTKESEVQNMQQQAPPSQTLPLNLAEYQKLKKKTEECTAALIIELNKFLQSFRQSSATVRSKSFANLKTFHRNRMLLLIEKYFNTEENGQPILPSTATIPSVQQIDVTSNLEASLQVVTTLSSPSISVTTGDQQLVEGSSSTAVYISTTEQHQSDSERNSDDCLANQKRAQAEGDSAAIPPESANLTVGAQSDANVSIKSEIESECECEFESNQEDDKEMVRNLLNLENDQVDKMQTGAQQQATVSIAVNWNNDQVADSNVNNNNLENLDDFQAMDFYDGETVDEQSHAEPIVDAANGNMPLDSIPTVDSVSHQSTSTDGRSTRPKRTIDYAEDNYDSMNQYLLYGSFGESPTVKRRNKRPKLQKKPFVCSQCAKAFTSKTNLTVHERVHSGLKPYHCKWPECDYFASQRTSVIYHVRCWHFGLPGNKKRQAELGIVDDRDARNYVEKITEI